MANTSYLSIAETAAELGVSYGTVRNVILLGRLRAVRIGTRGGTYRIAREDLDSFLRQCEVATAAPASKAAIRRGPAFTHLDPDRLLSAWHRQDEPADPPGGHSAPSSARSRGPSARRSS